MGYLSESEYQCDFCGFVGKWDESDEAHGDLWGCEVCGATFCSKCLKDKVGTDGYKKIMRENDIITCPNCSCK